eukprot:scaffold1689_cov305-Prasinococcus_capsulatus_cf.AAC.1
MRIWSSDDTILSESDPSVRDWWIGCCDVARATRPRPQDNRRLEACAHSDDDSWSRGRAPRVRARGRRRVRLRAPRRSIVSHHHDGTHPPTPRLLAALEKVAMTCWLHGQQAPRTTVRILAAELPRHLLWYRAVLRACPSFFRLSCAHQAKYRDTPLWGACGL